MKQIIMIFMMLIFGFSLFSQEKPELSEKEKNKMIEEVCCFTECTDFILYTNACVTLLKLAFKSEYVNFQVNDYNNLCNNLSVGVRSKCTYCNWQARKITPVDLTHYKVSGIFTYFITDDFGRLYGGKNSIKCELVKSDEGWEVSAMEELIVLSENKPAKVY